jgi:hypothetical protein
MAKFAPGNSAAKKRGRPRLTGEKLILARAEREIRKRYAADIDSAMALARQFTPQAIGALVDVALNSDDDKARVVASTALLERGWGKVSDPSAAPRHGAVTVLINTGARAPLAVVHGERSGDMDSLAISPPPEENRR